MIQHKFWQMRNVCPSPLLLSSLTAFKLQKVHLQRANTNQGRGNGTVKKVWVWRADWSEEPFWGKREESLKGVLLPKPKRGEGNEMRKSFIFVCPPIMGKGHKKQLKSMGGHLKGGEWLWVGKKLLDEESSVKHFLTFGWEFGAVNWWKCEIWITLAYLQPFKFGRKIKKIE